MIRQLLLAGSIVGLLGGCTVIGEEEVECPGSKSGLSCASVKEVYELTNVYNNAEDYGKATGDSRVMITDKDGELITAKEYKEKYGEAELQANSDYQRSKSQEKAAQMAPREQADAAYQHLLLPAPEPVAMRKPADIVRILIRPYTDEKDTLKIPGYSFVEAANRTWVVDRSAKVQNAQYVNYHMRRDSQTQSYDVKDQGEIGVESRNGQPNPTNIEIKQQGHNNAVDLIQSLK